MKEYWKRLTPAQKETRLENLFKGQRDAKKKAYAAAEPWAVRAEARAAEERARAAEERARAEARATEERARAEALALAAATAPLTGAETAALRAGGRAADLVQRGVAARARDVEMLTEGKAAKVLERQKNREDCRNYRKQKKAKGEDLVQDEARLMERAVGLLAQLKRGGSTVLDDDGAVETLDEEAFREDEEAIQDLVKAKEEGQDVTQADIRKKKNNLYSRKTRARQALAAKALQRRVPLLEIRVAELEEECYLGEVLSLV